MQVLSAADTQQHYGVELSLVLLADKAPQLVQDILASPRHLLDQLEAALISAQARVPWPQSLENTLAAGICSIHVHKTQQPYGLQQPQQPVMCAVRMDHKAPHHQSSYDLVHAQM